MENKDLKSFASQDLNYFEDFFLGDKKDEIYSNYKTSLELKEKGYQYFNEFDSDGNFVFEGWLNMKAKPIEGTDYIDFDAYLKRDIHKNISEVLKIIDTRYANLDEENFKYYFRYILNKLYSYLKLLQVDSLKNPIEFNSIKGFVEKLHAIYPDILKNHRVFNILNQKENLSIAFFLPKTHLNLNFFHQLYDITVDLEIIDDIEIEEEKFINLFILPNPTEPLKFNKSNSLVIYYLDQIKYFFDGLTVAKINSSKLFLNKQGKPITSNDIYTTRSRNSNSKISEKSRIQELVDELKEKFLK